MELIEGMLVEAVCPECKDEKSSFESIKEPNQNRAVCVGCRCSYNIWYSHHVGYCNRCNNKKAVSEHNVCFYCFNFDTKSCQQGEPLIELEIIKKD